MEQMTKKWLWRSVFVLFILGHLSNQLFSYGLIITDLTTGSPISLVYGFLSTVFFSSVNYLISFGIPAYACWRGFIKKEKITTSLNKNSTYKTNERDIQIKTSI